MIFIMIEMMRIITLTRLAWLEWFSSPRHPADYTYFTRLLFGDECLAHLLLYVTARRTYPHTGEENSLMKNEQGFSLVELLIVVAIIAIIAAIAVPSLLTSRMAANESGGMQSCRTAASAEVAYASTNNQQYALVATLVLGNYLDGRFNTGINGYTVAEEVAVVGLPAGIPTAVPDGFGFTLTPNPGAGRYVYGIGPDQVVRYQSAIGGAADPAGLAAGDGIGKK
jgi:prepilin-type N-terminal cleavage/methylation domain-containing protein